VAPKPGRPPSGIRSPSPSPSRRPVIALVLKILLAIVLPPVGAFLCVGIGLHFWLNILLTILGILPGQIHAVWLVVTRHEPARTAAT
jgi:uncharacterized membrane protein YqaE (UPF0057 family)